MPEAGVVIGPDAMAEGAVVPMASAPPTCDICMENHVNISLDCGHQACSACACAAFCNDIARSFVPVPCFGCSAEVPLDIVCEVLRDRPDMLEKMQIYGLRRALQRIPDARFCPHPNCSWAVICTKRFLRRRGPIQCQVCHHEFCFKCRQPAHPGEPCQYHDAEHTKPCPTCATPIFKVDPESCNAISCTICRTEFCWLCGKRLYTHGLSHYFSLGGCTMYGRQRWNREKIQAYRRSAPITFPLVLAGAAAIVPLSAALTPIAVMVEDWRTSRRMELSRLRRFFRALGYGLLSLIILVPLILPNIIDVAHQGATVGLACFAVRGAVFAYIQLPVEEVYALALKGRQCCLPRPDPDPEANAVSSESQSDIMPTPELTSTPVPAAAPTPTSTLAIANQPHSVEMDSVA
ncbi:uncharacterized protein MONBRDRAFT_26767 [Monosiga brevicollis MX1]|uniref:RBR-type E3 ubiquitin transferase n=1 Tax=Monosiga brevicollis TaxID=81824 RepID=A9V3B3_MONBE|nr:uncharacterized protein MONBRDRAFT_26767 [Monosiga brevicollis MX1]EDQ88159.1 predicted protein [Monosiga brevicollis MX1]|eukprot:XP_001747235.1 hypothetical protein [Monosiga brevicollis MX1]